MCDAFKKIENLVDIPSSHSFKKDELATLKFLAEVSDEEKIFLILAMLYIDLRLPLAERKVCPSPLIAYRHFVKLHRGRWGTGTESGCNC